jgi:hypothetical protein
MFKKFMKIYGAEKQRQIDIKTNNEQQSKRSLEMNKKASDEEAIRLDNIKKEKDEREKKEKENQLIILYNELFTNLNILYNNKEDQFQTQLEFKTAMQELIRNLRTIDSQLFNKVKSNLSGKVMYITIERTLISKLRDIGKLLSIEPSTLNQIALLQQQNP